MKRGALTKKRVAEWLQRRFFLRLHMFFIVGGTYLAGLLATFVLLKLGLNVLWLRYALAVCAAYLVFLLLIRFWLLYISSERADGGDVDFSIDGIDFSGSFSHGADASVELTGGGGNFGGGGATGSWGDAPQAIASKSSGGGGGGSGKLDGCGIDLGGADEGCVIVILIVLVFSLLVIGIYMIYTAPVLLGEAAFEAALAAALARRAKKMESRGWVGAIWRATVWPFIAVLVISAILGAVAQHHCPEAKRLRDVFECPSAKP